MKTVTTIFTTLLLFLVLSSVAQARKQADFSIFETEGSHFVQVTCWGLRPSKTTINVYQQGSDVDTFRRQFSYSEAEAEAEATQVYFSVSLKDAEYKLSLSLEGDGQEMVTAATNGLDLHLAEGGLSFSCELNTGELILQSNW